MIGVIEKMGMVLVDVTLLVLMSSMLKFSYNFMKLSILNKKKHEYDPVAQLHFQDHATAVIFALIGSTLGTVSAIWHIFEQHILRMQTWASEVSLSISFVMLGISGAMFMRHMIKEETPGHPFYVREYGENYDPIVGQEKAHEHKSISEVLKSAKKELFK